MLKRFLWFYGIVWLIFLFFLSQKVPAYWDDQASDTASMVFSGAGQNQNSTLAFSYKQPFPSGWTGLYASLQSADDMIVSEIYAGHVQGGFDVRSVGIEGYITALRDKWRAIDLSVETGYFIRPATVDIGRVTVSGGAGNYTERRDNDDAIGRAASDASTTFGWLAFLTGQLSTRYGEASATGRYKPSIDFDSTKVEFAGALSKEISDAWAVGVSTLTVFDSASITETDVHSSYLISFTYTPREREP